MGVDCFMLQGVELMIDFEGNPMVSNMYRCCAPPKQAQGGAALLVSLIMLLLMTVIGVATMNTTILESKMAGNVQSEVLAFNNAESSLRFAETDVQQNIVDTAGVFDFSADDGYYDNPVNLSTFNWDTDDFEVVGNDRYIVEYMGPRTLTGNSAAMDQTGGTSGSTIYVFQITARSQDNVSGSTQMLRSTYATLRGP